MRRKSALAERAYLSAYLSACPDSRDVARMLAMPGFIDRRNYELVVRLLHMRRWIWQKQHELLEAGAAWSWRDLEIVVPAGWGHYGHEPELQLSGATFLGMNVVRDPKVDRFTVRAKATN